MLPARESVLPRLGGEISLTEEAQKREIEGGSENKPAAREKPGRGNLQSSSPVTAPLEMRKAAESSREETEKKSRRRGESLKRERKKKQTAAAGKPSLWRACS